MNCYNNGTHVRIITCPDQRGHSYALPEEVSTRDALSWNQTRKMQNKCSFDPEFARIRSEGRDAGPHRDVESLKLNANNAKQTSTPRHRWRLKVRPEQLRKKVENAKQTSCTSASTRMPKQGATKSKLCCKTLPYEDAIQAGLQDRLSPQPVDLADGPAGARVPDPSVSASKWNLNPSTLRA